MRHFLHYWIAVLKLTKDQAFALFYRLIRYVAGTDVIELSEADAKAFAEALANPPEPCEALKEAARKYKADQRDDVV